MQDRRTVDQDHEEDPSQPPSASSTRLARSLVSDEFVSPNTRLVAVRYFLDRPGYGLDNSALRLWFHPPALARPNDICEFLRAQQIALDGLLIEIYLDQFKSFMMLEACAASGILWDFSDTSPKAPGSIDVRLTDLVNAHSEEVITEEQKRFPAASAREYGKDAPIELANVTPSGLFSFSMMVGLETAALWITLLPGSISDSFLLKWGPYMFFVGGIMQIIVGIFQVLRNNVYGATAFLGFGSFWCSNGIVAILEAYASDGTTAQDLILMSDPWGNFVRILFILAFCLALEIQTFAMNRLSSILIGLLCLKFFVQALAAWSTAAQWAQFAFGVLTSAFAFYVFVVEFTNQIYHRQIFRVYKWSEENSPEEVFGASGRLGTLHSKAARLRQARWISPCMLRDAKGDSPGNGATLILSDIDQTQT